MTRAITSHASGRLARPQTDSVPAAAAVPVGDGQVVKAAWKLIEELDRYCEIFGPSVGTFDRVSVARERLRIALPALAENDRGER